MRFFFFFKQKTAYEVRISDWSSDVCSSDLKHGERPADGIAATRIEQCYRRAVDELDGAIRIDRDHARGDARHHRLDQRAAAFERGRLRFEPRGHHVERGAQRTEIGSASCQESVCQYV